MLEPGVRSATAAAAVGLSVAVAIVRPNTTFCCRACRTLVLRQPKGRRQRGAAFIVSVGPRGASRWRWSGFEIRGRRKFKPRRIARFDWAVVGRKFWARPHRNLSLPNQRGAQFCSGTHAARPRRPHHDRLCSFCSSPLHSVCHSPRHVCRRLPPLPPDRESEPGVSPNRSFRADTMALVHTTIPR